MDTIQGQFKDAATLFAHGKYEEAKDLYAQGKYEEALEIFIHVYTIQQLPSVFGPEHKQTLTTHLNVAETFIELGKRDEASEIFTELEEFIQTEYPGHKFGEISRNIKAAVYEQNAVGHMDAIERQFKDAAMLFMHGKYEEAKDLNDQGKYEEALEIFNEIYAIQQLPNVFGPGDKQTLTTQLNIAETLIDLGKYDEAVKILTELEELIEREYPGHEFGVIARKIKAAVNEQNECVGHMDTVEDQIKEAKPL